MAPTRNNEDRKNKRSGGPSSTKGRKYRINEGASTSKVHGYENLLKENDALTRTYPGIWVECDECKKWRMTHQYFEQEEVPPLWNCTMWRRGEEVGSCDIPGDTQEPNLEHEPFPEGTVVWARMGRYPDWPSMVESDPTALVSTRNTKSGSKTYHVTFFGFPPTRGWVPASRIKKYKKTSPKTANSKKLEQAIIQGNEAVEAPFQERIINYSFPNLLVKNELNKTAVLNGFLEGHSDESEEHDERGPSTDGRMENDETENAAEPGTPAEPQPSPPPPPPAAAVVDAAGCFQAVNGNLTEDAVEYRERVVAQYPSLWGSNPTEFFRRIYEREQIY